jgi:hypothetical protein
MSPYSSCHSEDVHGFGTIVVGLVFVALGWFLRNEGN